MKSEPSALLLILNMLNRLVDDDSVRKGDGRFTYRGCRFAIKVKKI